MKQNRYQLKKGFANVVGARVDDIDSNKIAQGVVKSAKKKENPFNRA